MLKRPSPKDTEDDLLRFQDEYLASIGKKQDVAKAATAVYKNPKSAKNGAAEDEESHGDPAWFPQQKGHLVLGEVFERPFDESKVKLPTSSIKNGFPEAEVLKDVEMSPKKSQGRGMSLFARQMLAKQQQEAASSKEIKTGDIAVEDKIEITSKLMKEIDEENRKKLAKMTREEIESDRAELSHALPANLVEFLQKRNKTKSGPVKSPPVVAENVAKEETLEPSELPVKPDPKWVHMDAVESDKLEWTKDVPIAVTAMNELRNFETRFDFAGEIAPIPAVVLQPPVEGEEFQPPPVELPSTASALYHHGVEPDRPGYTLSELLELARSSSVQQRILALRTLAAICRQARQGRYLAAGLDKPVIPCLLEAGYAFTVRQALDDSSSEGNALASLTALHDLLIDTNDEELLENYLSTSSDMKFPYFCDKIVTAPLSDDEMKKMDDAALMSRDVVLCLVFRTNLIARLRYILCDWPTTGSDYLKIRSLVIAIFLRIARHSPACASQIANGSSGQRLMAKIASEELISKQENYLRLLAVIATSTPNAVTAHFDVNRLHEIVAPRSTNFRSAIEAVELLTALCNLSAAKNVILALGQRFVEIETIQVSKSSEMSDSCLIYLAKIFQLFASLSHRRDPDEELFNFDALIYGLLEPIFVLFPDKFISWLNNVEIESSKMTLMLSSAYHLAASSPKSIERMLISEKFVKLTEQALKKSIDKSAVHSSSSVVLQSFGGELKQNNESPRSLQYFNAIFSSASVPTAISAISNWNLANAIFQFLATTNFQLCQELLALPDIVSYFKLIATKRSPVGFANGFFHLSFELGFVSAYLKALTAQDVLIDGNYLKIIFTAVVKLLPLLPGLFSSQIWPVFFDKFIFNPQILEGFDKILASNIQSVRSVYRDSLSVLLEGQKFCPFSQSALCKDWLYFPLAAAGITVSLTSDQKNLDDFMPAMRHRVVVAVLRLVRFTLRTMPQTILQEMTPLTHFVKLSSLYLNDDVFGGAAGELEGVRSLLAECLTSLLKSANSLNFTERVPGLDCTLADFYIALLEQFKAASYGDIVFGNILLLFAGANQPVVLRRLLWGDHKEVLTFLRRLRHDQLLFEMDTLLQPFESSLPVIKLYAEFVFCELVSPRFYDDSNRNSVLWTVAVNHLNAFLFDSSERSAGKLLRKSIWQAIAQQVNDASEAKKSKLKDLVFYKYCSPSSLDGNKLQQLYNALPQNRLIFLRSVLGEEACRSFLLSLMN